MFHKIFEGELLFGFQVTFLFEFFFQFYFHLKEILPKFLGCFGRCEH